MVVNERIGRLMEHFVALFTLALMLVLLLSACGGTRILTPAPTPGLPFTNDLQAALLTTTDLPPGWERLSSSTSNHLDALPCDTALPDLRLVAATTVFDNSDGERISETLASFHPGDAEAWLTALKAGPDCGAVDEGEQEGTPIVGRVTQPAFPSTGEESYALRVTTNGPSARYVTDLVYVRMGDFILEVGDTTVGRLDPDLTTSIVQQAILDFQGARLTP
jgi:hypothetical protein